MAEPWFDPNTFGAYFGGIGGGVGGTLLGVLGGLRVYWQARTKAGTR